MLLKYFIIKVGIATFVVCTISSFTAFILNAHFWQFLIIMSPEPEGTEFSRDPSEQDSRFWGSLFVSIEIKCLALLA